MKLHGSINSSSSSLLDSQPRNFIDSCRIWASRYIVVIVVGWKHTIVSNKKNRILERSRGPKLWAGTKIQTDRQACQARKKHKSLRFFIIETYERYTPSQSDKTLLLSDHNKVIIKNEGEEGKKRTFPFDSSAKNPRIWNVSEFEFAQFDSFRIH